MGGVSFERLSHLDHSTRPAIVELRHLRYFVAVAEESNFSRAADRLHMAQPPLSTQIRALEQEIGAALFDRDRRGVALTHAGRHFLEDARAILAMADRAKLQARGAAAGDIAAFGLGYTASAMFSTLLPPLVRRFQSIHPQVLLDLQEMGSLGQLDALQARTLDIGILRKPDIPKPKELSIEEWIRAPLVAAITHDHPLARSRSIGLADLRDEPFIVYPRAAGIGLYWRVIELCANAGFRPRVMREAREASSIISLVAAGIGVAIVPSDTQCIHLEGVSYKPLRDPDAFSALHLAYRTNDRHRYLLELLEMLRSGAATGSADRPAAASGAPPRGRRASAQVRSRRRIA